MRSPDALYMEHVTEWDRFYKLPIVPHYGGDDTRRACVLDLETTGLEEDCKITELSIVPFSFGNDLRIGTVHEPLNMFNDPGFPIPPKIVEITGVTDALVRGHKLDLDAVHAELSRCTLVIAHNARFDRPVIERALTEAGYTIPDVTWVCSSVDPGWKSFHIMSSKLDYLAFLFGYYFKHHRAEVDCRATIHLLVQVLPNDKTVFQQMITNAFKPSVVVKALNSPFSKKDKLKEAGYNWNAGSKSWDKTIPGDEADSEKEWLDQKIYEGRGAPQIDQVDMKERFRR